MAPDGAATSTRPRHYTALRDQRLRGKTATEDMRGESATVCSCVRMCTLFISLPTLSRTLLKTTRWYSAGPGHVQFLFFAFAFCGILLSYVLCALCCFTFSDTCILRRRCMDLIHIQHLLNYCKHVPRFRTGCSNGVTKA